MARDFIIVFSYFLLKKKVTKENFPLLKTSGHISTNNIYQLNENINFLLKKKVTKENFHQKGFGGHITQNNEYRYL